MYYVIGSGPAGIACASALIEAGHKVTLLDAGLTLDAERERRRLRMSACDPSEWTKEDIWASRAAIDRNGDVPAKLCHGSDYPYQAIPEGISIDYGEVGARGSFAKGGLSNVWGAALLPFRPQDTDTWPVSGSELEAAHAAILRMLPVAGARDDLVQLFPLPTEALQEPKRSKQIERLLFDLKRSRAKLAARGVIFGSARLAVRFTGSSTADSCNYCGHCLHGCPRDLIYSSRHTLAELLATGKLVYVPGVVVDQIEESNGHAIIHASVNGERTRFEGKRAFLAAGVFNSTAILLRSLGWYDRSVDIADSQYYVFPLLQLHGAPDISRERLYTLAQVFLEISDTTVSPHSVHLQIYGYNDLLADMLKHKLGLLWPYVPHELLLGRLLLVQGFLHSDHSGRIRATLRQQGGRPRLELTSVINPASRDSVARVMRHLSGLSPAMRAMPVTPLLQMASPGRSFHCGGSFPMDRKPHEGQTDTLGRPCGWSRLHVADATVFPSVPATTMTQTVMANAYRIGLQSAHLDPRDPG